MTDVKGHPSVNSNWPKTKKSMEAHNERVDGKRENLRKVRVKMLRKILSVTKLTLIFNRV